MGYVGAQTDSSATPVNDNNWHFVCSVKNGSSITLYFDGVLKQIVTDNTTYASTENLDIGNDSALISLGYTDGRANYTGYVNDVRIYNRALSQQEITALYTIPSIPTLIAPTNSASNISVSPTLSWNSATDASSYRLQVSIVSSFGSTLYDQSGLSTTQATISGLANNANVYWQVNASNANGTSDWSSLWSFTTIIAPPLAPVLASPTNSALGQPISLGLSWGTVTGAVSYSIQVSTSSNFGSTVSSQTGISVISTSASGLANGTLYYWEVNATNAGGTSAWSNAWNFTTIAQIPTAPILASPANGAINIQINISLVWNASSGAASYRVQLSNTSSFSLMSDTTLSTTSRVFSSLTANSLYYWRVYAINSAGNSAWSSIWSFTTVAVPTAPALLFPGKWRT